jgi:digeranylgeranylglycerophospholipid reductase
VNEHPQETSKNGTAKMSVIDCDVLVVGAGPAGSVAALYCSRHGLKTVLIEKNTRIGQNTSTRIDSSPDVGLTKIVKELDLKTENLVFTSKWYSPDGSSFTLHSKLGEYYFKRGPERDSFECSTVAKAIQNGCTFISGAPIEEIRRTSMGYEAIRAFHGTERCTITPTIMIVADGGNSIFHKNVALPLRKRTRVACGVTGRNFSNPDTSEIYLNAELAPGGYLYLVTCPTGLSSAGIVVDAARITKPLDRYFSDFLAVNPALASAVIGRTTTFAGAGSLFSLKRHSSTNLLLVGEAAGLLDPLMGYGMMPAIVSGYYAGKYSVEAVKSGDLRVLHQYERALGKRFDNRGSYILRAIFEYLDNKDLDMLISMANQLEQRTSVDNLIDRLSIMGVIHVLPLLLRNLPRSARMLVWSCKGLIKH